MAKVKKTKAEFSDEVINDYLRKSLNAGQIKKSYDQFSLSQPQSEEEE